MDEFYIAVIALMGAVFGSVITAWAQKNHDISKFERQNRNDAYLMYLKGISMMSFLPDDHEGIRRSNMEMAEARSRIALFGSADAVEALVAVFSHGSNLWSDSARGDVSHLIEVMRKDSQKLNEYSNVKFFKKRPLKSSLFELLYGKSP